MVPSNIFAFLRLVILWSRGEGGLANQKGDGLWRTCGRKEGSWMSRDGIAKGVLKFLSLGILYDL